MDQTREEQKGINGNLDAAEVSQSCKQSDAPEMSLRRGLAEQTTKVEKMSRKLKTRINELTDGTD